jgi:RimJ/RimL family protein N-acetyltransferase
MIYYTLSEKEILDKEFFTYKASVKFKKENLNKDIAIHFVHIGQFPHIAKDMIERSSTTYDTLKYNPNGMESKNPEARFNYEKNTAPPLCKYLVFTKENNKYICIGLMSLYENFNSESIGFFYFVSQKHRGKKYGDAIAQSVIYIIKKWKEEKKYDFQKYTIIEAVVQVNNMPSNAIVSKYFTKISTGNIRGIIGHTYELKI